MNNKELFNKFKKQVAIYNFEQEKQRTDIYPLEKNTKEWGKYIMKKKNITDTCNVSYYLYIWNDRICTSYRKFKLQKYGTIKSK